MRCDTPEEREELSGQIKISRGTEAETSNRSRYDVTIHLLALRCLCRDNILSPGRACW